MQALTFLLPEEEKEFRLVGGTLHFWWWKENI